MSFLRRGKRPDYCGGVEDCCRRRRAATVLRPLIAEMKVGGGHSVEIEALRANAWFAICTLVESLEKHRGATDDRWERAISNVETLEKLLI